MNLFLDTSALIKLYHHEDGSANITRLLNDSAADLVITIADITEIEFHSAIMRRVRTGEIGADVSKAIFSEFNNDLGMFNMVNVDGQTKKLAISLLDDLADVRSLKTLDALQLASAIRANQFLSVDLFVSADNNLLTIAENYFSIFNPLEA